MNNFKADLTKLSAEEMFRKHIILRNTAVLTDHLHFTLRNEISKHFKVDFTDILVVGSAKLGFSIKPQRRWGLFGDDSDIDVAIVSGALFHDFWMDLHQYKISGGYWPKVERFYPFFFQGWIRPDLFPSDSHSARCRDWWEFFNSLGRSGRFGSMKIRAGLYCNWQFLESYQCVCIEQCKQLLTTP